MLKQIMKALPIRKSKTIKGGEIKSLELLLRGSGWVLSSTDDFTPLKKRDESTLRASNQDDTK